jgi:hypothetical protein
MDKKALLIKQAYHLTKHNLALDKNDTKEAKKHLEYYEAITNKLKTL